MKTLQKIVLLCTFLLLAACSKRSNCPTYWDSDPKLLFGELSVEDRVKSERLMPTSSKKFQRENDLNPKKYKKHKKKKKKKRKSKQRKRMESKF